MGTPGISIYYANVAADGAQTMTAVGDSTKTKLRAGVVSGVRISENVDVTAGTIDITDAQGFSLTNGTRAMTVDADITAAQIGGNPAIPPFTITAASHAGGDVDVYLYVKT